MAAAAGVGGDAQTADLRQGFTAAAEVAAAYDAVMNAEFDRIADSALLEEVIAEHDAAVRAGITGVPAVMRAGGDAAVPGALPVETYRRWVERALGDG